MMKDIWDTLLEKNEKRVRKLERAIDRKDTKELERLDKKYQKELDKEFKRYDRETGKIF